MVSSYTKTDQPTLCFITTSTTETLNPGIIGYSVSFLVVWLFDI